MEKEPRNFQELQTSNDEDEKSILSVAETLGSGDISCSSVE